MRILALADEADKYLWSERCRTLLDGVDLILAAGDLPAAYLSFLTCFTPAPIVYVRGNHDDSYDRRPPEGCLCAEDRVLRVRGVRIAGLGGCMRYRPDGRNMFTEAEMAKRIRRLRRSLRATGCDILLTHAPVLGCGDQPDPCHRGFACLGAFLEEFRPAVMVHGHVHQSYSAAFVRRREYAGVPVINAYSRCTFDLPESAGSQPPTRWGEYLLRKTEQTD